MTFASAVSDRRWLLAAALWTAAVSALLLVLPLMESQTSGQAVEYQTLIASQGRGVILPLIVPTLIGVVPLLVPGRYRQAAAWVSTTLLAVYVVLGLLSVGLFFVPSTILFTVGALRSRS